MSAPGGSCKGGCGFFGSDERDGFCSQCFEAHKAEEASTGAGDRALPEGVGWAHDQPHFKPALLEHYVEKLLERAPKKVLVIADFISHWHPLKTHPVVPGVRTNPTAHLFTRVDLVGAHETVEGMLRSLAPDCFGQGFQRVWAIRRGDKFDREHLLGALDDDDAGGLSAVAIGDVPTVPVARAHPALNGGRRAQPAVHLLLVGVDPHMDIGDALEIMQEEGIFSQGPCEGILPHSVGVFHES